MIARVDALEDYLLTLDCGLDTQARERFRNILAELSALPARVAELEKVVERLPRDKTGAIRAMNDRVYHPDWMEFDEDAPLFVIPRDLVIQDLASHELEDFVTEHPTGRWFVSQCHYDSDGGYSRDGFIIAPVSECYPTKELAESDLAGKAGDE